MTAATAGMVRYCADGSKRTPDPRPERDAVIAATAVEHNHIVVTRNTADFENLGVVLVSPWDT